jgi:lipopolysaccharide/colanic/teichoic acid biosynthesis glycosyltransferase
MIAEPFIRDPETPTAASIHPLIPQASHGQTYLTAKRAFDIVLAGALLIALSPIWLVAALLVRVTSPGPILFRQTRVGLHGRAFTCLKLRTMRVDAEACRVDLAARNELTGPVFKMRRDPRVTGVGRWLRKSSIDELPQLINVLRGEMSIVGPRPPLPAEVADYSPYQMGRLTVTPGMTCLWQVRGRNEIGFDDWVELDIEYIRRRSFAYDLWLIVLTIPAVITGRGAF